MFFALAKVFWKNALAYRAQYYLALLIVPLNFIVLVLIWNSVGTIKGYDISSLITYFIISTLTYSLVFNDIGNKTADLVRSGDFVTRLTKPFEYIYYGFVEKVANRAFAFLAEAVPLLVIVVLFFGKYFYFGNALMFFISIILSFVLSYFIFFSIACLAFWMVEVRQLVWLLDYVIKLASGGFFPLDMFPAAITSVLNLLPFQYVVYIPVSIYLDRVENVFAALSIQAIWCVIMWMIAHWIWNTSMKKFCGEGT